MAQTIQQRLEEVSTTAPTSQVIADGLGATPQQVAMTGTQVQKQATIADRIAQAPLIDSTQAQRQELGRVERLEAPRREPTVEEALEAERQDQLAKLGNIGQSIQKTISENLAAVGQQALGQVEVEQSILAQTLGLTGATLDLAKADPNSNYNKITNVLETYLASGDPNDLEAAYAAIDNLKIHGIKSAEAKRLIGLTQETMAKQTGQIVSESVMDQVTMMDLDLQALGFEAGGPAVAELLGVSQDEFNQMSLDQFTDAIEDKRRLEFARIDNLKAELRAAPLGSLRREILLRELRDLGQVGITGIEQEAVENVEDINLAGYIKVGDQEMKVSDFLDDENLSQMVIDWINEDDPARKDDIISEDQFPELIEWVRNNQEALAKLSQTADDTKEVFDKANEDNKVLNVLDDLNIAMVGDVMSQIMPNWNPEQAITSSQLAELQGKFNSSIVGQLSGAKGVNDAEKKEILNKFNALNQDTMKEVFKLSVDDIRAASSAAEVLLENQDLARFFGFSANQGFVLDENTQKKIAEYDDVIATIARRNPQWLAGGVTLDMMKGMSAGDLQKLVNDPRRYDDLKLYATKLDELKNIRTIEDKMSFIFGSSADTLEALNSQFADARKWAALGDSEAEARVKEFESIFGTVGVIDETDLNRLMKRMTTALNQSTTGVAEGRFLSNLMSDKADALEGRSRVTGPSGLYKINEKYISDGQFTLADLESMTPAMQDEIGAWVDSLPGINIDLGGFSSYKEYDTDRKEEQFMSRADEAAKRADLGDVANYERFKGQMAIDNGRVPTEAQLGELEKFASFIELEIPNAANDMQRDLYNELLKDIKATLNIARNLYEADKRYDAAEAERVRRQMAAMATGAVYIPGLSDTDLEQRPITLSEPIESDSQLILDDYPSFITT